MIETSEDRFLGGALRLRQPARGYRAGFDAVVLAAACDVTAGADARCIDCGAGIGAVGLALAHRLPAVRVTLVERELELSTLSEHNAVANGLADRIETVIADVDAPLSRTERLMAAAGQFDHVLANPPYHDRARGTPASDRLKDRSHAMAGGGIEPWIRFAAAMARNGGSLTMIHRPAVLPELLAALSRRFGRVRILPLHARPGELAGRILVRAEKGSRAGLELLAGRIVHRESGHGFTPEFEAILRQGATLGW